MCNSERDIESNVFLNLNFMRKNSCPAQSCTKSISSFSVLGKGITQEAVAFLSASSWLFDNKRCSLETMNAHWLHVESRERTRQVAVTARQNGALVCINWKNTSTASDQQRHAHTDAFSFQMRVRKNGHREMLGQEKTTGYRKHAKGGNQATSLHTIMICLVDGMYQTPLNFFVNWWSFPFKVSHVPKCRFWLNKIYPPGSQLLLVWEKEWIVT